MGIEHILMIAVLAAGFYMAWNIGANDVANAMGTSVGSGALTLKQAVIVAAVLEFSGALLFGSHVSETVQKGIIDVDSFVHDPLVLVCGMLACLLAAGVWLQIASYYGWPVSTTHTIVGSIVGFGFVYGGVEAVQWENVSFIVSSWVLSPILGGIFSFLLFTLLKSAIFYAPDPVVACKKIAPLIFGLVASVLTLVLIFNGLKNLNLQVSFWHAAAYSAITGIAAVYCSFLWLKKRVFSSHEHIVSGYGAVEALDELEQAKHHLMQASSGLSDKQRNRLTEVAEQMDLFKNVVQSDAINEVEDGNSKHYGMIEQVFSYLQIMSACLMAFAHGANDVANAIGPLGAAIDILQTGAVSAKAGIPTWVLALGAFGIVIGLATWGWRVIETIGKKITELTPTRGFAAEFGAALTIVIATRLGMPVSTTHTLVGSVIGVGLARGMGALNLSMTRDIFISWIVTVPAGAALTIFMFYIIKFIFHI